MRTHRHIAPAVFAIVVATVFAGLCCLAASAFGDGLYDRAADRHDFTVFMEEGGWCWYQDPRAIVHDDKLFLGSVSGHGGGDALVGLYDLRSGKPLGSVTLHEDLGADDHNSPVFHVRPDGSVLAVYAKHHKEPVHYWRASDPENPMRWSVERRQEWQLAHPDDKVTYANLFELADENTLYLFFRGSRFHPTLATSNDHGRSWSEPMQFVKGELPGHHRPYPVYAGDGRDTIHIAMTDSHPREYGNSIYYLALRGGRFQRANGSPIKPLSAEDPVRPSEAELVYQGSGNPGRGQQLSAIGSAWTSSIAVDAEGHPHIAYTLYLSNDDHRYRVASWDGDSWTDREVAHGGNCLYPTESSYTGLISLDPADPAFAVISTDVDPRTGEDRGGQHEIYRARIGPDSDVESIEWQPVTRDSPVRNIRPVIVRDGDRRIVLWNRGVFRSFNFYQLDLVGFVEEVVEPQEVRHCP